MPISVTGPFSFYFVQFSFFFYVSCIFRTIGPYMFAFWLLAMNMLILYFHDILVVWPSLMCCSPPLFSLVLLVCSWLWILCFQLCSKWFGSSIPYMLLCFQLIICCGVAVHSVEVILVFCKSRTCFRLILLFKYI